MSKSEPVVIKKRKYDEWDIRNWADKLQDAEEIKNDPVKMKLLKPYLKKKVESLEDLREIANNIAKG